VADIGSHHTEVALVTGAENHMGRVAATLRTGDLSTAGLDWVLAGYVLEQVRGHLPAADNPAYRDLIRDIVATCQRAREDLVRHTATVVEVRFANATYPGADRSCRIRSAGSRTDRRRAIRPCRTSCDKPARLVLR
jgi:hypothetical protein